MNAFSGCTNLAELTTNAGVPPTVGYFAFDGIPTSIPVTVPWNCAAAYKDADGWKEFTNIKEMPLPEVVVVDGIAYHLNEATKKAEVRPLPDDAKYTYP